MQPVTRVDARLPVTTGGRTLHVPVTWYPARGGSDRGLVWLQHGFARSRRRMAPLAHYLAGRGLTVLTTTLRTVDPFARTVQNLGGNTGFLRSLATALTDGLPAAWAGAGLTGSPPPRLLAAGHSAGADAAAYVVGCLTERRRDAVAGLLLLDPVKSATGTNLADGLSRAGDVPARIVAAAPSRCNNHGSGVRTALTHLTGFAGVRLIDGSHLDAEGPVADRIASLVCGAPRASNVAALEELSGLWLRQMVGDPAAQGASQDLVEDLVARRRAEVLWGHRGSTSSTR